MIGAADPGAAADAAADAVAADPARLIVHCPRDQALMFCAVQRDISASVISCASYPPLHLLVMVPLLCLPPLRRSCLCWPLFGTGWPQHSSLGNGVVLYTCSQFNHYPLHQVLFT